MCAHQLNKPLTSLQSAIPHIMVLFIGDEASIIATVAEQLAVFRILRALKMVRTTSILMCLYYGWECVCPRIDVFISMCDYERQRQISKTE